MVILVDAVVVGPSGQADVRLVLDTGAVLTTLVPRIAESILQRRDRPRCAANARICWPGVNARIRRRAETATNAQEIDELERDVEQAMR